MRIISSIWLTGIIICCIFISEKSAAQVGKAPSQKSEMDRFVSSLMSKMTLEEKIGQLNLLSVGFDVTGPIISQDVDNKIISGKVGGIYNTFTPSAVRKLQEMAVSKTRLGIPLLFGYDVIHGHKTILPIPLGLSATWDMELIEKGARLAAKEASADGLNWTFSPMVDIARDPRWGRIAESSGEDAYLGSKIAHAMVKGYQGESLHLNNTIMACVKHFALYGAAEAGRDYNTVDMSITRMYNEYLPPYKAAVDAGVGSVMSSFNEINGIPATSNKWLMTDVLRKQWGFTGFVVTDYTAINELVDHGLGKSLQDVSALALNAGIDMDMVGEGLLLYTKQSLAEGKVTLKAINDACRLILEAKYKLGLFQDPYLYIDDKRAESEILTSENRKLACNIAQNSMVLLKNENQVLPLKTSETIALIGPLADTRREMLGCWSAAGDWSKAVSVREGIQNLALPGIDIKYAKGCNLLSDRALLEQLSSKESIDSRSDDEMIREAFDIATKCDIIVAVLGEPASMSGEAASLSKIGLPGRQLDLLKAMVRTGKPVVLVLMNGRPLTLQWENENVQAILEAWHPGTEAGNAVANVLFGKHNPCGKLTATFPINEGQIPIYYNHKNTGRPFDIKTNEKFKSRYLDIPNEPLFPFGFGLSYTTFEYSELLLSKSKIKNNEKLTVTFTLANTGKYDGSEVVQLYVRDLHGSYARPVKELKGFKKVFLKSGEKRNIEFTLTSADLGYYNNEKQFLIEPGDFKVFVGTNSQTCLETSFELLK